MAEFLGISAAAAWYGAINVWIGEPGELPLRIGAWVLMSLAAVPEGLVLGGFQVRGLSWFFSGVSTTRWVIATTAVCLAGWGIGSFIPLFAVDESAYAAAFGLCVGAVFGAVQALALPGKAQRRLSWILSNAIGWGVGLPLIYGAAQIASNNAGWVARMALSACGGLGAGIALVGMGTARSR